MKLEIDKQVRGTRIMFAQIGIADDAGFDEIILPSLEMSDTYTDKAGPEILGQMYVFPDKKDRKLCLRPEGTATVQVLADKYWKTTKDLRLWYFERCWRYERPQAGRYREFFQFGVETINPRDVAAAKEELIKLAKWMVSLKTENYEVNESVKRGLQYYVEDGFEISCPQLGAQKQVCGGGTYKQGIGFAIGFDRLMLCE